MRVEVLVHRPPPMLWGWGVSACFLAAGWILVKDGLLTPPEAPVIRASRPRVSLSIRIAASHTPRNTGLKDGTAGTRRTESGWRGLCSWSREDSRRRQLDPTRSLETSMSLGRPRPRLEVRRASASERNPQHVSLRRYFRRLQSVTEKDYR